MDIRSAFGAGLSTLLLCGTGLAPAFGAATLQVCSTCTYRSIQSAVNAAASGDTIDIAAGRYVENVLIEDKQLTLIGAGGALNYCSFGNVKHVQTACPITEVSGVFNGGPVFVLGSGVAGATPQLINIQGLTISHGSHPAGSAVGGGIQVRAGAYLSLSGSIVTSNAAQNGGGIGVDTPGAPATTISNCLIDSNSALFTEGFSGGINPGFGGTWGGGIAILNGSAVAIENSTVTRNQANDAGGIYLDNDSTLTLSGTTVSENTATGYFTFYPNGASGGGLYTAGSFTITNSSITDNTALGHGGGGGLSLSLFSGGHFSISSTIIDRNIASSNGNGGGLAVGGPADSTLSLVNDFIVENQNGGVLNYGVSLVLNNTIITANTGGNLCQLNVTGGC